jgi:hypothetical protein
MKTLMMVATAVALCAGAPAQVVDLSLFHADVNSLPPAAREAYEEAVDCNNHTDQVGAVQHLLVASQAAPDVIELQWLLCETAEAYVRGDNFGLEEALRVADQVVQAYERILASENLPDWARPTVERYNMRLQSLLDGLDERIRARRELSDQYMNQTARMHEEADAARERYTARVRADRANNPNAGRVNSGDAVMANPLLLPSDHYDHAQIRGRTNDVVNATSSLLLPSRHYR